MTAPKKKTALVLLSVACWTAGAAPPAVSGGPSAQDLLLIDRLTYGVNASTLAHFESLGRTRFLAEQLHYDGDSALPAAEREAIAAMSISHTSMPALVAAYRADEDRKKQPGLTDDQKKAIQDQINAKYRVLEDEAFARRSIRALYSRNQLQEQMAWFWFNHFMVFLGKGNVRLTMPDYEEQLRSHSLGKFRDLVYASLTHPAMLVYLDNAQNEAGKTNENYARELMELHTLGVNSGYTQTDVQELARILTGVGVNFGAEPVRIQAPLQDALVQDGAFVFNPAKHDSRSKRFLGVDFAEGGEFNEVREAIEVLVKNPATAHFIAHKLAVYFLADEPPAGVVDAMARTFRDSDGDIARTLGTLFNSTEFRSGHYFGRKFKDPNEYVYSSVRLFYDGKPIVNFSPLASWMSQLGEPPYGHQTPDGYGLAEKDWASSEQMTKRFELSKSIASTPVALFVDPTALKALQDAPDKGLLQQRRQAEHRANVLDVFALSGMLDPILSAQTRAGLKGADSFDSWGAFLASSPEFMYR